MRSLLHKIGRQLAHSRRQNRPRILWDETLTVVVDPKGTDFARYRGATVIKPNVGRDFEAAAIGGGGECQSVPVNDEPCRRGRVWQPWHAWHAWHAWHVWHVWHVWHAWQKNGVCVAGQE